jgi:hypothetical protein
MMTVANLLPFFKVGAVGAGFAFLVLTFRLLARELRRKVFRRDAILAVFVFAAISLLFLLVGIFAERIVPDPFVNYVTLDMGHYGFDTTTNTIKFQMSVANPDEARYIKKSEASQYQVIVAFREESQLPVDDGTYVVGIGGLSFATIDTREWKPATPEQLSMFQSKCVRFTIFGLPSSGSSKIETGQTFQPKKYKYINVFESRSTGNHCS